MTDLAGKSVLLTGASAGLGPYIARRLHQAGARFVLSARNEAALSKLAKELGAPVSLDRVAESITRNFGRIFSRQILWVETLDALLGNTVGVPARPPSNLRKLRGEDETFWA